MKTLLHGTVLAFAVVSLSAMTSTAQELPPVLGNVRVDDGTGRFCGESCLCLARDGALYAIYSVDTWNENPRSIVFKRSDDGGRSWSTPETPVTDMGGFGTFPYGIAELPDGTIGVLWGLLRHTPKVFEVRFSASFDGGGTFGRSLRVHPFGVTWNRSAGWITTRDDTFVVAFLEYAEPSDATVRVAASTDRGATWIPTDGGGGGLQVTGPSFADNPARGELAVVWKADSALRFAATADGGATWSEPVTITALSSPSAGAPSIVADSGGRYHAVWYDYRGSVTPILWSRSDDGVSWEPDRAISGPDTSSFRLRPRVTVDPNDALHVAWESWTGPPSNDLEYTHSRDGGVTWLAAPVRVNDVPVCVRYRVRLAAEESGRCHFVWDDDRELPLYSRVWATSTGGITPSPIEVRFVEHESIVKPGEGLDFVVAGENRSAVTKDFHGWLEARLETGEPYPGNPILSGRKVWLAGTGRERSLRLPVRSDAPPGTYQLVLGAGRLGVEGASVWAQDSFFFTILP